MMIEYGKRFVEVEEVLNHLSRADYNKIPMDIKELIKNQKDKIIIGDMMKVKH